MTAERQQPEAFFIMQVGDSQLDEVYEVVFVPAARAAGLIPRRIDLDNEGGLLNAEILDSIERADLLVADLTNERPNCYLEVGVALGLGRSASLVLTVRQDHLPGRPDFVVGGPKVHFDLAGYDLLLWDPDDLPAFQQELERRIQRRLAISSPSRFPEARGVLDEDWIANLHSAGLTTIEQLNGRGFMEVAFALKPPKLSLTQRELFNAARLSTIDTFGWPVGVFIDQPDSRPKPTGDGIHAEVSFDRSPTDRSFDLWELKTNGDFFTILSLFEDQRQRTGALFFDTRIIRITEALLYCGRLYTNLAVPRDAGIEMVVTHGGLEGRGLTSSRPHRHPPTHSTSSVDFSTTTVSFMLGDLDEQLTDLVKQVAVPLFELFDFFQLGDEEYDYFVDGFVRGEVK